jgi:D-alanyl-D-alanine carboxypeptidase/D-alanyl-D-alanine-endopeptidase (penicillin-binding protein 4)
MTLMREARTTTRADRDPRHGTGPGPIAHWLPVVLVVALLASGVAAYRFELGERWFPGLHADPTTEPAAVPPPAGLDLPDWTTPSPVVAPVGEGRLLDPARVAAAVTPGLGDEDLGKHVVAAVGDLEGAGPDWTSGDGSFVPASTTKVLTAAAVLEALGPDHRFTTSVVRGAGPRDVVLVGGGDPYLASKPATGSEAATLYPQRADLVTLAVRTAQAVRNAASEVGQSPRVRVRFDDSLFAGPTASPGWREDYVPDDIVSPITALMADGGREEDGFRRYDDPSLGTAQVFAAALQEAGLRVVGRPQRVQADPGAAVLASAESAPLSDVVERVLDVSDNEGAEVLAHHAGLAIVGEGSFDAGARATIDVLDSWGVDTSGVVLHDGSGLSRRNLVTATAMLGTLRRAASDEGEQVRAVITGLPVAGFTGSLAYRFDDAAAVALGVTRAKTGTLTGVHSLAGLTTGRDGTPMVFVVAADRVGATDGLDAQAALDRVAAALARCRCGSGSGAAG